MSDDELDRDWKPTARPQSTMARSFSLALNDLFKIDNSLADLDAAVSEKKQKVSSQTSELEALEARLRATEERLKAAATQKTVSDTSPGRSASGRSSPHQRTPLGETFTGSPTKAEKPTSPLASEFSTTATGGSRPATATRPGGNPGRPNSAWKGEAHPSYSGGSMPGALPPTPGASEGEYSRSGSITESDYVLVDRERRSADFDFGEDGDMPPPPPPPKSARRQVQEEEEDEDDDEDEDEDEEDSE